MTLHTTRNNAYAFKNGRVTCPAHDLWGEAVFQLSVSHRGLKFRTTSGWWLTTPVVSTEVDPEFVLA